MDRLTEIHAEDRSCPAMGMRVLCVCGDDPSVSRHAWQRALSGAHHTIYAASADALVRALASEDAYDLILCETRELDQALVAILQALPMETVRGSDPPMILLDNCHGEQIPEALLQRAADIFPLPRSSTETELRLRRLADWIEIRGENARLHRESADLNARLANDTKLITLGRMFAQLSHEISNPLNVVHNNIGPIRDYANAAFEMLRLYREGMAAQDGGDVHQAELAKDWERLDLDYALEDFPAALASVESTITRVVAIQTDVRAFLRGEEVEPQPCDVNDALGETIELVARGLSTSVAIVRDFAEVPPVMVRGRQIDQVFLNLLKNAIEAVDGQGTIHCRTRFEQGRVRIEIADDGPGIPVALRTRVFEPFFTTKGPQKGTGLGLAVCHQIVAQNHRGSLFLEQVDPHGARFVVELPIADEHVASEHHIGRNAPSVASDRAVGQR